MQKNFIPLNSLTKSMKELVDKCIYSIQEQARFYGLESRTDGFISLRDAICLESEVTWANGRIGRIIDKRNDGVYSFLSPKELAKKLETYAKIGDNEEILQIFHEIANGGEYVAIGILGYWLKYGKGKSIKEVFKAYTKMQLNDYIEKMKTHPQSWKWPLKYKFFVEYAIEEEKRLNRMSEAIFDFVDGAYVDIEEARSVMTEYISYLESERDQQLAKHASKAPRAIATREDCSFVYKPRSEEDFGISVEALTSKLKKYQCISEDVSIEDMASMFKGQSCRKKISWRGSPAKLAQIFRLLINRKTISTWPENTGIWKVVTSRFLDSDNQPFDADKLRKHRLNKKFEQAAEDIASALVSAM